MTWLDNLLTLLSFFIILSPSSMFISTTRSKFQLEILKSKQIWLKSGGRGTGWVSNLKYDIFFAWYMSSKTHIHCVKRVQIWSYFWSVFSCIRTRNNSVFDIGFKAMANIVFNLFKKKQGSVCILLIRNKVFWRGAIRRKNITWYFS